LEQWSENGERRKRGKVKLVSLWEQSDRRCMHGDMLCSAMWKTWAQFSSMDETKRSDGRKDALNGGRKDALNTTTTLNWKEKATWKEVGVQDGGDKQCSWKEKATWVAEAKFEQSRVKTWSENGDDDDATTLHAHVVHNVENEFRWTRQSGAAEESTLGKASSRRQSIASVTALGRCSSQTASNGVILSSTSWYTNVKFVRSRVVRKKKKDRN
jgi:hypothetical protein